MTEQVLETRLKVPSTIQPQTICLEDQLYKEHLVRGVTNVIAKDMNSRYPCIFIVPQKETINEFSKRMLDVIEDPFERSSIQEIKTHYIIFCQHLIGKDIYFPCLGPVPYHIQRKREQAAVDETFCRKEK